jgi:hypothetical protein
MSSAISRVSLIHTKSHPQGISVGCRLTTHHVTLIDISTQNWIVAAAAACALRGGCCSMDGPSSHTLSVSVLPLSGEAREQLPCCAW